MKKIVLSIAIFSFMMTSFAFAGQLKVVGDTNGDHMVDPRDALLAMQIATGMRSSQNEGVYYKIALRLTTDQGVTYFPAFFAGIYSEAGSYTGVTVIGQPVAIPEIATVYPGDYLLGFNFRAQSGRYLVGGKGEIEPWSFKLEVTNKTGSVVLLTLNQGSRFLWRDNGYGGGNLWTAIHVSEDGLISLSPNAPFLLGDADGDNIVDVKDAVVGLRICSGFFYPTLYPDYYHVKASLSSPGRAITYAPFIIYGTSMEVGAWNATTVLPQPVVSASVSVGLGEYTPVTLCLNFRDQNSGQYLVGGSGFVQDWNFTVQVLVDGNAAVSFNQDDRWAWRDNGHNGGNLVITFRLNRDGSATKI